MNASVSVIVSLIVVALLMVVAGVGHLIGLDVVFGVVIPYVALLAFVVGLIYRMIVWAKSPVPFRIPTTCGQNKSLSWIKSSNIENPTTTGGVIVRMLLEILFFRSLFRNTSVQLADGNKKIAYGSSKWLWVAALVFHYSFLVVVLRHLRYFLEPMPFFVYWMQNLDGFLQIGAPVLYVTGVALAGGVSFLLLRRLFSPNVRYISLPADYFPLLLILAIAVTGILMRYFMKVDIVAVKELTHGLVSFSPKLSENIGGIFYIHVFLVSVLVAYIPWSKLLHMPGVFFSPTRNMANNNRVVRHINPWNHPVKVHTYEEYEDEFREKMKAVDLPVEKE